MNCPELWLTVRKILILTRLIHVTQRNRISSPAVIRRTSLTVKTTYCWRMLNIDIFSYIQFFSPLSLPSPFLSCMCTCYLLLGSVYRICVFGLLLCLFAWLNLIFCWLCLFLLLKSVHVLWAAEEEFIQVQMPLFICACALNCLLLVYRRRATYCALDCAHACVYMRSVRTSSCVSLTCPLACTWVGVPLSSVWFKSCTGSSGGQLACKSWCPHANVGHSRWVGVLVSVGRWLELV